jgi:hypothetical protein
MERAKGENENLIEELMSVVAVRVCCRVEPMVRSRPVLYRVTYRAELLQEPELVEAEGVRVERSGQVVLWRMQLVIGAPREVVVRRLSADRIVSVDPL